MSHASAAAPLRRVLIAERRLPAYRVALFEALRAELALRRIELIVAHGQPSAPELSQHDDGQLEGATVAPAHYLGPLCWQPFDCRGMDLVIMGHENRLLFNHWLGLRPRRFKLACFGHGANFASAHPSGWREAFKRWSARRVDWWFAYTALSQQRLVEAGVAAARITVVNNSLDTRALADQIDALSTTQRQAIRSRWGLTAGKTALFIGSLYPAKRIDLLLRAASLCAAVDADFRLLVIGDGVQAPLLQHAASQHGRWLRWLGADHGQQRAEAFAVASVLMLPAAVGLAIVDGFAAGLPLFTTDSAGHGPEIAYLQPGVNGERVSAQAETYAAAVMAALGDGPRLQRLQAAARQSASALSLEAMVTRFADGIEAALAVPR